MPRFLKKGERESRSYEMINGLKSEAGSVMHYNLKGKQSRPRNLSRFPTRP
jgi:hypothetical protein